MAYATDIDNFARLLFDSGNYSFVFTFHSITIVTLERNNIVPWDVILATMEKKVKLIRLYSISVHHFIIS